MFLKVPHATFSAISFDEKSQRWIANSNLFFCYTCTLSCLGNEVRLTKIARVEYVSVVSGFLLGVVKPTCSRQDKTEARPRSRFTIGGGYGYM